VKETMPAPVAAQQSRDVESRDIRTAAGYRSGAVAQTVKFAK
jgi:hypothetical protein